MLSFENDYSEGAHPKLLQALTETNLVQQVGYGEDEYSLRAKDKIRAAVGDPDADIFFLIGGTQSNQVVIDGLLHSTEGVIAATTGHVNVHEAGAIEGTGHKIITVPGKDGKITAEQVEECLHGFYDDETWMHMAIPSMVYISYPTEFGTLYSLKELEAISDVCRRFSVKLYVDGARLGYGLASKECDITIKDLYRLCDAFYIGGTKVGTLIGEAVVLKNKDLNPHFSTDIKRGGAMLAKGRLLGLQFETMFADNFKLYLECGRNGVDRALELRAAFEAKGWKPCVDSPTNQQFFQLPNTVIDKLTEYATFELWGPRGNEQSTVRFVTNWATKPEEIAELAAAIPQA